MTCVMGFIIERKEKLETPKHKKEGQMKMGADIGVMQP